MNYVNIVTNPSAHRSYPLTVKRPYHHGDLKNALLQAARQILEEKSPAALSLREVARRAGVSHAAPYRHFPSHEALLAELAREGFDELNQLIAATNDTPAETRIDRIGTVYIGFVTSKPTLARLMFGPGLPNRDQFPALTAAASAIAETIGATLGDTDRGLAVWAAIHGTAMLMLENVVAMGRQEHAEVTTDAGLPPGAQTLLRTLTHLSTAA